MSKKEIINKKILIFLLFGSVALNVVTFKDWKNGVLVSGTNALNNLMAKTELLFDKNVEKIKDKENVDIKKINKVLKFDYKEEFQFSPNFVNVSEVHPGKNEVFLQQDVYGKTLKTLSSEIDHIAKQRGVHFDNRNIDVLRRAGCIGSVVVEIESNGYTCIMGDKYKNLKLSERRANRTGTSIGLKIKKNIQSWFDSSIINVVVVEKNNANGIKIDTTSIKSVVSKLNKLGYKIDLHGLLKLHDREHINFNKAMTDLKHSNIKIYEIFKKELSTSRCAEVKIKVKFNMEMALLDINEKEIISKDSIVENGIINDMPKNHLKQEIIRNVDQKVIAAKVAMNKKKNRPRAKSSKGYNKL